MATPLIVSEVSKSFTMHLRGGLVLPVVSNVSFSVASGECVVLGGPSGAGKSSLLKMVYGNYGVDAGLGGPNVAKSLDDDVPYTPAWACTRSRWCTRSAAVNYLVARW